MAFRWCRPILVGLILLSGCAGPQGMLGAEGSGAADTQTASNLKLTPPRYQVGDEWQYSDGYGMRVASVNGDIARFDRLDAPGQWFTRRGIFREQAQSQSGLRNVVFRSGDIDEFYKLPFGQPIVFTREYTRNGEMIRHNTSYVIEGVTKVTVPAGTFEAFIIVMRTRSLTGSWTGFERIWYAPALRNYVRMEYRYGDMPDQSRVLVNYRLS